MKEEEESSLKRVLEYGRTTQVLESGIASGAASKPSRRSLLVLALILAIMYYQETVYHNRSVETACLHPGLCKVAWKCWR